MAFSWAARVVTALTVVSSVSVGVTPVAARSEIASGRWVNEGCALTSYDPATGRFECAGTTDWTGTWTGVTTYTIEGSFELLSGDATGTIDETFFGVADDGSAGSLRLFDTFTLDGSTFAFHLEFRILGGTGDFEGSRGSGTFDGTVLVSTGYGSYSGHWIRPHGSKAL